MADKTGKKLLDIPNPPRDLTKVLREIIIIVKLKGKFTNYNDSLVIKVKKNRVFMKSSPGPHVHEHRLVGSHGPESGMSIVHGQILRGASMLPVGHAHALGLW